jgi:Periplasmic component of the Tol biopolymer transport system
MAINRDFGARIVQRGVLLLFLHTCLSYGGSQIGQIKSIALSPNGKVIAVGFDKGNTSFIYKVAVDTGRATRLTSAKSGEESMPAFSPDGKQIAYSYSPENGAHYRIVIGNIDGSDLRHWAASESDEFSPVFMPDSKTVIFSRSGFFGSYSPIAQPHSHAWRFYSGDLDGTNVRELTSESFYMASPASASPDGKHIVIATEGVDTNRNIAVYSLDRPGKPTQSLQPHVPGEVDHKNPIFNFPNYMPDGKSILFMAASGGKHGYDYDVYLVDLGTGSLVRLTNGNGYATDLKLSADGNIAVFLKWHSDWRGTPDRSEPYLLDMQTHKLRPLKVTGLD